LLLTAFPYSETDDQLRSAAEIKHDMEKSRPMDRLLASVSEYGKASSNSF
jgi:transcription-repair coupling factor (superfamily II helicase)